MKIVVCVKQVPDMSEAKMDRKANTIVREGVSSIINPYDIHAVEEALRIKEKKGGSVTALSMGIPSTALMLKQLVTLGLDKAILLTDRAFAGSDTLATCYTLSKAIEKIKDVNIIICGKQTADGDTAQVGPSLAEMLNISHITNVVEIVNIEEQYITCRRAIDKGWELVKTPLPAVITVDKDINVPRFPTVTGIRNMRNAEIEIWNAESIEAEHEKLGLKGSPTQVVKTFIPQTKTASETITGPADEQAGKLISLFNKLHINIIKR